MDDQANQPKDQPNKIFDVTAPGKTPATSTSKPVIVGNQPEQKDPMVNLPNPESVEQQTSPELREPQTPDEPTPTVDAQPKFEAEPQPASAEVPAPEQGSTNKNEIVVVHNTRPKLKRLMILLLIILVVVIVVDLLLDAQIIKSSAIPHTHFLKN